MNLSVKVTKLEDQSKGILALANVTFDECFRVTGIRLIRGKEKSFISMPSVKTSKTDEEGKPVYQDIAYPLTKELREKLTELIITEYETL